MMFAASAEEPAAQQTLSPVQLSPRAQRRRARAFLAARRPRVRATSAYWRIRTSAARADLDDQLSGHDAHDHPMNTQQETVEGLAVAG